MVRKQKVLLPALGRDRGEIVQSETAVNADAASFGGQRQGERGLLNVKSEGQMRKNDYLGSYLMAYEILML